MVATPRVTIVDDDPSVRKALSRLFRSVGYAVQLFDSSEAFLDSDAVDLTDCLILDVHLPGMSGIELQETTIVKRRQCPIVFITAYDDEATRIKAISDGAIEFLRKPLDVDHLLRLVENALAEQ